MKFDVTTRRIENEQTLEDFKKTIKRAKPIFVIFEKTDNEGLGIWWSNKVDTEILKGVLKEVINNLE